MITIITCTKNQSNGQHSSQNGRGKCGKRVVKGDICDVCKKFLHFKCTGAMKEEVQDAGVLICKVCKEKCSKCTDYRLYNKTRAKKEIRNLKLEKHVEHLNNELASIHNQYDEKEKEYERAASSAGARSLSRGGVSEANERLPENELQMAAITFMQHAKTT